MHNPYCLQLSLFDPINLKIFGDEQKTGRSSLSNFYHLLTSYIQIFFPQYPILKLSRTNEYSEIKLLRLHSIRNGIPHVGKICSISKRKLNSKWNKIANGVITAGYSARNLQRRSSQFIEVTLWPGHKILLSVNSTHKDIHVRS